MLKKALIATLAIIGTQAVSLEQENLTDGCPDGFNVEMCKMRNERCNELRAYNNLDSPMGNALRCDLGWVYQG